MTRAEAARENGKKGGRPDGSLNKNSAAVKAFAGQYSEEAILGLVRIARGKKTSPAAKVAAWREVLDRAVGKAPQALTDGEGGALIPAEVIHQHISADAAKD